MVLHYTLSLIKSHKNPLYKFGDRETRTESQSSTPLHIIFAASYSVDTLVDNNVLFSTYGNNVLKDTCAHDSDMRHVCVARDVCTFRARFVSLPLIVSNYHFSYRVSTGPPTRDADSVMDFSLRAQHDKYRVHQSCFYPRYQLIPALSKVTRRS